MGMMIRIIFLISTCILLVNACGKQSVHPRIQDGTYGLEHRFRKDNWETHVGGGIGFGGEWQVGVGVRIEFRKRRAQLNENKYNITIKVDPCFFLSYDLNRNGEFAKDELLTIFGNDEKANALFADLDTESGDGVISEEEFYAKAPLIIADCFNRDS